MHRWRHMVLDRLGVLTAAGLLLAVVALWIPAGFVNGIIEEWLLLDQYRQGLSPLDVQGQFLRPLVLVPFYAGFVITPESFVGLNLVLMFAIWGRGVGLFLVLREIGAPPAFSLATAFLFALYPADDGLMSTRTVGIQMSVMLLLVSAYLLLRLGRRFNPWLALATITCLAITILGYEAPLPLAMVTPLLLLWTEGRTRSALMAAFTWYGVLIPLVVRYAYLLLTTRSTYQGSLVVLDRSLESVVETIRAAGLPYARALWRGWGGAVADLGSASAADVVIGIGVAVVASALVALVNVPQAGGRNASFGPRSLTVFALAALGVIGVGFLMYLPTNAREATWRTLFLPSIGGAVLTTMLLWAIAWLARRRAVFSVGVGVLLVPAFVHLAVQHRGFEQIAANQARLLDGIAEAAPRIHGRTRLLLLFDETGKAISHEYFPFSRYLRAALAVRFGMGDLNAHICYPFTLRRNETCTFDPDSVQVAHQDMGWLVDRLAWDVPYEEVVALVQDRDGNVRLLESLPTWYTLQGRKLDYDPGELVDTGQGFRPVSGGVRVEFEEQLFVGAGWDVERRSASGITYRFMSHPSGALHLPLQKLDYLLELRIANGISEPLLESLSSSVDGLPVPLERLPEGHFRGVLPAELVKERTHTTLLFHQDAEILRHVQTERGPLLGLGFDWVRLIPKEQAREKSDAGKRQGVVQ